MRDTSNIKAGKTVSYEQLCNLLGEKAQPRGAARVAHIKDIRRSIDMTFNRKGKLWKINSIYEYVCPKKPQAGSKYIGYIEAIILNSTLPNGCDICSGTKYQFYEWLGMANYNFTKIATGEESHAKDAIEEELEKIFIQRTNVFLDKIFSKALQNMVDRGVITYTYNEDNGEYKILITPNTIYHSITGLYYEVPIDVEGTIENDIKRLNNNIKEEMSRPNFFIDAKLQNDFINEEDEQYEP